MTDPFKRLINECRYYFDRQGNRSSGLSLAVRQDDFRFSLHRDLFGLIAKIFSPGNRQTRMIIQNHSRLFSFCFRCFYDKTKPSQKSDSRLGVPILVELLLDFNRLKAELSMLEFIFETASNNSQLRAVFVRFLANAFVNFSPNNKSSVGRQSRFDYYFLLAFFKFRNFSINRS
jgi:hypothetical protein